MQASTIFEFERQNSELAKIFKKFSGKEIHFFPNYGNAGDSLIASATYQLLNHYQVPCQIHTAPAEAEEIRDDIIFLGGGGNMIPLYKGMANLMRAAVKGNNEVYLLPHSVRGHETLLQKLPRSVTIFCREALSYQHVQFHARRSKVVLGHDLGLYLDANLLNQHEAIPATREKFEAILARKFGSSSSELAGSHISCIRGGVEATISPDRDNYDISVLFKGHVTPREAEASAWMLHEFTRIAGRITSNRLHVCISAALAGTPVEMYDNSYGKVSGVYLQSMRDRFQNAKFKGQMQGKCPFSR
jgi:exopolysaccharide biosynthesis predicted pyruvyltransferase EpsI